LASFQGSSANLLAEIGEIKLPMREKSFLDQVIILNNCDDALSRVTRLKEKLNR
jgi:hypothetical protein